MSAPSSAERYSLNAARMPCMSCPTGVWSMFSVAETRVALYLRRNDRQPSPSLPSPPAPPALMSSPPDHHPVELLLDLLRREHHAPNDVSLKALTAASRSRCARALTPTPYPGALTSRRRRTQKRSATTLDRPRSFQE